MLGQSRFTLTVFYNSSFFYLISGGVIASTINCFWWRFFLWCFLSFFLVLFQFLSVQLSFLTCFYLLIVSFPLKPTAMLLSLPSPRRHFPANSSFDLENLNCKEYFLCKPNYNMFQASISVEQWMHERLCVTTNPEAKVRSQPTKRLPPSCSSSL